MDARIEASAIDAFASKSKPSPVVESATILTIHKDNTTQNIGQYRTVSVLVTNALFIPVLVPRSFIDLAPLGMLFPESYDNSEDDLTTDERAAIEDSELREASAASLSQFGTDRDRRSDENSAAIREWMRERPTLFQNYRHYVDTQQRLTPQICPICLQRMRITERLINVHKQTDVVRRRRRTRRRRSALPRQCCFHERCFRKWAQFSGQIVDSEARSVLVVPRCPSCEREARFSARPRSPAVPIASPPPPPPPSDLTATV